MKIIITKNYSELSKKAAEIIINEIVANPKLVMGFATGSTPLGLYKELVRADREGKIDFSGLATFNLDEYYPIKKSDKQSYYYFMFDNLFNKVKINKNKINVLNGEAKDPQKECRLYEDKLQKNKIDIQILGIGANGHIGFNEPGSSFSSKTRLVDLREQTIKENSRFFARVEDVPKKALTMGIANIMKAKKIMLLASGIKKAKAVKRMIEGQVNESCPASVLQKHPDAIVILDKGAASLLKKDKLLFDREKKNYRILQEENIPRGKRIVVVSPHPDDVSVNCGGMIALLAKYNKISAFIMTTGWRAYVPNKTKEEIIKIREREAIKESKILGFRPYFLRLSFYENFEGRFEKKDIKKIIEKLKTIDPDVIFLPQKKDDHPTHKLSRKILLKCLGIMKKKVELWNYETMWDLFNSGEFNTIVSFSEKILRLKIKGVKQHKSQTKRIAYNIAVFSLAKFRGILVPEEEIFGYGKKAILKDKNIELFFVE
ncbi:glucosamine-6-phosphate deaminase [Patescibacteria group bacterium]|nr:glucosamine-6-phosphate deaminase [Patescibacteria group bacterium]